MYDEDVRGLTSGRLESVRGDDVSVAVPDVVEPAARDRRHSASWPPISPGRCGHDAAFTVRVGAFGRNPFTFGENALIEVDILMPTATLPDGAAYVASPMISTPTRGAGLEEICGGRATGSAEQATSVR
jgi:hypothetical protein